MVKRALVYADVNINIIDGSTSWLVSIVNCLAIAGYEVDVLSRELPRRSLVVDSITDHSNVRLRYLLNGNGRLSSIRNEVIRLHKEDRYDVVISRGFDISLALCKEPILRSVLWVYLVGFPSLDIVTARGISQNWKTILNTSRGLLVQTPELRSYIESVYPLVIGKVAILEPMVPDVFYEQVHTDVRTTARIGYAGKFDKPWHTLEIPQLPGLLNNAGKNVELIMYGDKIQVSKDDASWHKRMHRLKNDPPANVIFPGALRREGIASFMASVDLGIGWRDAELNGSYEISTKLLEFSAVGTPVICNRTAIHERVFGKSYPLFVDDSLESVAATISSYLDSAERTNLGEEVSARVAKYSFTAKTELLQQLAHGSFEHPISRKALGRVYFYHSHDVDLTLKVQFLYSLGADEVSMMDMECLSYKELLESVASLPDDSRVFADYTQDFRNLSSRLPASAEIFVFVSDEVFDVPFLTFGLSREVTVVKSTEALRSSLSFLSVGSRRGAVHPSSEGYSSTSVDVALLNGDTSALWLLDKFIDVILNSGLSLPELRLSIYDPHMVSPGHKVSARFTQLLKRRLQRLLGSVRVSFRIRPLGLYQGGSEPKRVLVIGELAAHSLLSDSLGGSGTVVYGYKSDVSLLDGSSRVLSNFSDFLNFRERVVDE